MKSLLMIWKDSIGWSKMSTNQRKLAVAFGISFSLMILMSWSWLVIIPAVTTIILAKKCGKELDNIIND